MTSTDTANPPARPVRVRIAPSPTGLFHVGTARSMLFNVLFAQQHDGAFVLRIEDTDASRNKPEWVDGITEAMAWLGVGPDQYEGPYFQSANAAAQAEAAQRLFAEGKAYYCDCTRDDVLARTGDPHKGYDGHCRERGLASGPGRALRFRTPREGKTTVIDLVRGAPTFDNAALDDFVIVRADGSVLFLLANVVDDALQRISHVLRAEEHLSNTPKQQLLWIALGETPPIWAHLPIITNARRQKISKRRPEDRTALEIYRAEGYLPAAMRNYLMLLGWAPPGDQEIVPWEQIERDFRLEDVNPSPAMFDLAKLRAFNGDYIRALSVDDFVAACRPWVTGPTVPWRPEAYDADAFAAVAPLAQTRIAVLSEITANIDFLFLDEAAVDDASWAKAMTSGSRDLLDAVGMGYAACDWTADELKARLLAIGEERGLKLGKAQAPVRVAVTGRTIGLPLFESLEVLGRDRTLQRIHAAAGRL
ncbi:MAG: glutamate--tRNA ligase [Mycobacteriales bacterium]